MVSINEVQSQRYSLIQYPSFTESAPRTGFFEVVAYTSAILLTITPIVWIFDGGDEALGTLQGAGLLAGVSVPVILAKNIGKRKDVSNDWEIRIK